jgi:dolichol-phosphate mannosyltransferase
MSDDAATLSSAAPLRVRIADGLRHPGNWLQLMRFGLVGASGYAINLLVFGLAIDRAGLDHRSAATLAFVVAVTNNFAWNRHWTFQAREGHAGFQAARFLVVSLSAFLLSLALLEILVAAGVTQIVAQAIAIVCATPVNFLGNRLWSFRDAAPVPRAVEAEGSPRAR